MTTDYLTDLLTNLRRGIDPTTGEAFPTAGTPLADPAVGRAFGDLLTLIRRPVAVPASDLPGALVAGALVPDALVREACGELRSLGYDPTVLQLTKVLIGSRSIVDPNLKAVRGYKQFRGIRSRKEIHDHLLDYSRRHPLELSAAPGSKPAAEPVPTREAWRAIDFFRTEAFDKLDRAREVEIRGAVADLGLRKATDRLPAFMATARNNYPRAFEPWTRDEQALLIEAMCYTNRLDKLTGVFGRSANSLEATGQRLIWESKEKRA